jgi:hypothetical protein
LKEHNTMSAGNNFATHDGSHVGGAVAMAIDQTGLAVPIESGTPIGAVGLTDEALEKFCRALAAHAVMVSGDKSKDAMEKAAQAIMNFARGAKS